MNSQNSLEATLYVSIAVSFARIESESHQNENVL